MGACKPGNWARADQAGSGRLSSKSGYPKKARNKARRIVTFVYQMHLLFGFVAILPLELRYSICFISNCEDTTCPGMRPPNGITIPRSIGKYSNET